MRNSFEPGEQIEWMQEEDLFWNRGTYIDTISYNGKDLIIFEDFDGEVLTNHNYLNCPAIIVLRKVQPKFELNKEYKRKKGTYIGKCIYVDDKYAVLFDKDCASSGTYEHSQCEYHEEA